MTFDVLAGQHGRLGRLELRRRWGAGWPCECVRFALQDEISSGGFRRLCIWQNLRSHRTDQVNPDPEVQVPNPDPEGEKV